MKKLLIFDLDGTLLDTIEDIRCVLNSILEKYGLKTLNRKEVISKVGYGARRLVELAVGDIDKDKLEVIYSDYVKALALCKNEKTVLYDGLDEVLKALKKDGYKLAIVSNKPDDAVKVAYKDKLVNYEFDFVMGNMPNLFNPKPDKSCVEYCLNQMGISKKDAVYIGDSEVDVETFINSEVDGISVLWGFRGKEVLEKFGSTRFASTGLELYEIIKSFN